MQTLFTGLKKISMTAVLAASLAAGVPAISQATPILRYTIGGGTPVSVVGAGGDAFIHTISSDVHFTFEGTSKPLSGSAEKPNIDLTTMNVYNGGSSTISVDVRLSDVGFTSHLTPLGLFGSYGGTLAGGENVEFWSYASLSNAAFDTTSSDAILLNDSGPITGAGAFGANWYSSQLLSGPYSLTLRAHYILKANKTSSADQNISVPEPSVLGMVGLGLLMVGLMGLRFRQVRYHGDRSMA